MSKHLGDQFAVSNLTSYFSHSVTKGKVHILSDATHMIKLCRYTLGKWKMLFDENNKPLKWLYFQHLVNIQDKIGLHDGKKI